MPKVYKRITKGKYDRRKICQYTYTASGELELVKEWDTATQIYNELGFDKSAILRCCKGIQKKSYWYTWKFKKEEELLIIDNKNGKRNRS
jgi:hypothetical protein